MNQDMSALELRNHSIMVSARTTDMRVIFLSFRRHRVLLTIPSPTFGPMPATLNDPNGNASLICPRATLYNLGTL
jgi:hypothetical protein